MIRRISLALEYKVTSSIPIKEKRREDKSILEKGGGRKKCDQNETSMEYEIYSIIHNSNKIQESQENIKVKIPDTIMPRATGR